jgi:hypothetical protein
MALPKKRASKPVKATDEVAVIGCTAGDNGRVLGYDTAHGSTHRHFAGEVEEIEPAAYGDILERFIAEIGELKTRRKL